MEENEDQRAAVLEEAFYQQATKAGLYATLKEMEEKQPEEFAVHLGAFVQTCPSKGPGKKRETYDWSRLKKYSREGLNEKAAERLWHTMFQQEHVKKDDGTEITEEQEAKNPTEKDVDLFRQKRGSIMEELDAELEGSLGGGTGWLPAGRGRSSASTASTTAQPKPAPAPKKRASTVPLEASKFRSKTHKEFQDVRRALEKAKTLGEKVLEEAGDAASTDDVSLLLVQSRMKIVEMTMNPEPSTQQERTAIQKAIYELCLQDPFLKDLENTVLSQSSCFCLAHMNHVRQVELALKPNTDVLFVAIDEQKNGMRLL
ncbi:hypothetical protein AK812_SmicGene45919, partial [Symbiodinium microadriaticum]